MDQYPDENEEFELQYQDELELMNDFPPDEQNGKFNAASRDQLAYSSKSFADYRPAVAANSTQIKPGLSQVTLNSPQLSQISFNGDDSQISTLAGPVNRRLFGTPKQSHARGASTPLVAKSKMPPIQEVIDIDDMAPSTANKALEELERATLKRKRLERDLFGNIDDIFGNETYEDPEAKKARTEEERDLEIIEKILETRKKLQEQSKAVRKDNLSRLEALHAFKMRNLSYTIPQWPFMPLRRSDDERVYVRFHSEDYETKAINEIKAAPTIGSLLGENKQKIWDDANELILKRANSKAKEIQEVIVVEPTADKDTRLWVEKYKPRKYIDLLSDEMTNRSLLYWLKMWDKVVFGKEFKALQANANNNGELNTFNKRTGKFESTGGWRPRKSKQLLNTNVDEMGRPMQKVALLCGPPGLGKTTLAHTIARHAGYNVREINASDDRSPEAFKMALENDEIDGAPRQSIEFLVKFVTDSVQSKAKTKGGKATHNILKRPIICICNDVYDPALRPLRQIAFVVTFPPIDSARLAERLVQVAQNERLKTDFGTLISLAEKSGNDVRCCISTMQFFSAQKNALKLQDVLNNNLGQKDRHQGLFDVWGSIFRIQRPKKQLTEARGEEKEAQVTMTDMSISTRVRHTLDVVHSGGDYGRLMQGVYENYLQQKMPDPDLNGVVEATQWFCFSDIVQQQINHLQNYTVYPYLQYGFVIWHLLFASLAWPKINFPTKGYEFQQKLTTQKNIFQSLRKSFTASTVGIGQGSAVLLETVPLLKYILSPQLRSVAIQLLSQKEQADLKHCVEIMVDLGITYTQVKSADGPYIFRMEPDLDTIMQFPNFPGVTLSYFGRQLVSREVELERIHRSTPKAIGPVKSAATAKPNTKTTSPTNLPNHLQRLKPKRIETSAKSKANNEVIKCFFNMKSKYGEACCNVLPAKLQNVFEAEVLQLLPNRDQHGRRILVLEAGKKWKPSKVPLVDLFRGIQLTVLGSMVEPLSQICGAIVIIDVEGLPMGHVMQFTPNFAAMLLDYVQDCICMRLKAVHIVNNSYIFNILFNIFKPFIREKLRKRIFFHGKDFKSLTSHIEASALPPKYGGTATWELPSGKLLGEFFNCYTADFEKADSYGFTEGYKAKK
ncbi:Chromosome transmission fidelity protein 18 like protein [Lucilia cuprina]|nr:Chromosome transmission fidelity protein 18 like protein [Lucilia cuprina]